MSITVPTNSKGEICDVQLADQFQPAKTQFACGFYACAIARSMARPGTPPTLSVAQVIADGLRYYQEYDGSDAITNTNGMTDVQLWTLLHEVGLHYQETSTEASILKQWLRCGYPVIVAVVETSVLDNALGENPYPWEAQGTHIVLFTGLSSNGNFLVEDSANCTSLYNANSLRPGPREYDASKIQVVSATVAVPPWLPRPASAIPPAEPPIQVLSNAVLPDGWTDDGTTLTAPNKVPVIGEFRIYVLTHDWESGNLPMGPEVSADPVEIGFNQADGNNAGTRQIFYYMELCRTSSRTTYVASVGREFSTALQLLAKVTTAVPTLPVTSVTPSETTVSNGG